MILLRMASSRIKFPSEFGDDIDVTIAQTQSAILRVTPMLANSVRLLARRVPAASVSLLRPVASAGSSASFSSAPKSSDLGGLDFSNVKLSGTPSPWAVFDAWGAGNEIHVPLDDEGEVSLNVLLHTGSLRSRDLWMSLSICSFQTIPSC